MNFKTIAASAAILALSVAQAAAGQCGYDYCWGAVGIGQYGAWGYSFGQYSESDAIIVAQNGCNGNCYEIRTFYNTCGAMAVADNGAWGFGWHGDSVIAESEAMSYCMDGGYNCQVRVSACSH